MRGAVLAEPCHIVPNGVLEFLRPMFGSAQLPILWANPSSSRFSNDFHSRHPNETSLSNTCQHQRYGQPYAND